MRESFFILSSVNGKTQGLLTFMSMSFHQYNEWFIWKASVFGSHYSVKCVFLMKVISADQADINTKDTEDCFGVQMEMVWCRGIMNIRELGLRY